MYTITEHCRIRASRDYGCGVAVRITRHELLSVKKKKKNKKIPTLNGRLMPCSAYPSARDFDSFRVLIRAFISDMNVMPNARVSVYATDTKMIKQTIETQI